MEREKRIGKTDVGRVRLDTLAYDRERERARERRIYAEGGRKELDNFGTCLYDVVVSGFA